MNRDDYRVADLDGFARDAGAVELRRSRLLERPSLHLAGIFLRLDVH